MKRTHKKLLSGDIKIPVDQEMLSLYGKYYSHGDYTRISEVIKRGVTPSSVREQLTSAKDGSITEMTAQIALGAKVYYQYKERLKDEMGKSNPDVSILDQSISV